jgi:alkanesulfonate monooxygenase SsuD/methylene tetrahydromethanopterin reductase-like flavin-dependent oxidoreductase (luciferase family)
VRFHLGETMTPVANLLPLAKAAEELGYNGYAVSDSLLYPEESNTSYSYREDGSRNFLENKPVVESFVLASAIGATTSLEITTSVVKLPVRHPVYAAKLAASVAAISKGRFNFGVGLSVWPEDYAALGVPYEERGRRLDECIEIVRGLTAGGYYEHHGEYYDFAPIKLNPLPPGPLPILVGGHSDAALKRAARNDGWTCAGASPDALAVMIAKLNMFRAESGRTGEFRIFESDIGALDYDDVRRKEDAGVTDLIVYFRNIYAVEEDCEPLSEKIDRLRKFSDEVIARCSRTPHDSGAGQADR